MATRTTIFSLALVGLIFGACTSRTRLPEPASTRVAAAEGSTIRTSTHDLEIPPGALAIDTEVTLAIDDIATYPPLADARPDVLRIDPEGTVLEVPATVTVHPPLVPAAAGDRVSVAQLAGGDIDAGWHFLESTRDPATGNVTVGVTRFAPLAVVVQPPSDVTGASRIEGTLVWAGGTPVSNAPVQLYFRDAELATAETDPDGRFAFADLEPGLYSVVVRYECDLGETVELGAGDVARLDLVLCGRMP